VKKEGRKQHNCVVMNCVGIAAADGQVQLKGEEEADLAKDFC
jgi:hypothetical protein